MVNTEDGQFYTVILNDTGSCDHETMQDLLDSTFGITRRESSYLLKHMPVRIVSHMKKEEAEDILEMFRTYGAVATLSADRETRPASRSLDERDGAALFSALLLAGAISRPFYFGPGPGPGPRGRRH
jgi:hypothetical protein